MRFLILISMMMTFMQAGFAVAEDWAARTKKHTIELADFTFDTGDTLPSITMSVYTLGEPRRGADGKINNAVMLLHGTGGSGMSLMNPLFGDELFGPGQPLDISKMYLISPDNLGHGDSSKPSDGMGTSFPKYDYDDMVRAQYRMLTEGLGVEGLEMIIGTSMGCMHSFVWGPTYPGFVKRMVPLACNAIEIAGRNRMFRQMVIDGFQDDPAWNDGNYENPSDLKMGQRIYAYALAMAGGNPYAMQATAPTRDAAIQSLHAVVDRFGARGVDPIDTIYQFDASRTYNPAPHLDKIKVPVLWINSADDFINPPGLGDPEGLAKRMPQGRFILIPASEETRGHGTHTAARFYKQDLIEFLKKHPF